MTDRAAWTRSNLNRSASHSRDQVDYQQKESLILHKRSLVSEARVRANKVASHRAGRQARAAATIGEVTFADGIAAQCIVHHRRPMARRLSFSARASRRSHAQSRRACGRRRALPASLRQCRAMRSESRVASHRDVSAESSLGDQRHSPRCAPHELGQGGRCARLRSCSVRLHRHQPGSARPRR